MRLLLLLPIALAAADKCSVIPSDLWCSNRELEKTCGFSEHCNRYRSATRNQPVQLTLFMEAFCPGCQAFIIDTLAPMVLNFKEYLNVELVPYGNAHRANGTIVCQHGEGECLANKYESCLINFLKPQMQFPFIACVEYGMAKRIQDFQTALKECYQRISVPKGVPESVESCVKGDLGIQLQNQAADRTNNAWPEKHQWVPWFMVNNVSLTKFQVHDKDLSLLICEWYTGDRPIPYCSSIQKKKLKTMTRRYWY